LSRQKPIGRAASAWWARWARDHERVAQIARHHRGDRLQQPPDREQRRGARARPDPGLLVELHAVVRLGENALDVARVMHELERGPRRAARAQALDPAQHARALQRAERLRQALGPLERRDLQPRGAARRVAVPEAAFIEDEAGALRH
jgi:hypothetical protein